MQQTTTYNDLGGGINAGAAPAAIASREVSDLRNYYPYGTVLRRRGGIKRLTAGGPWTDKIYGFKRLKRSDGTQFFLTAGLSGFGRLTGNSMESILLRDTFSSNPGSDLWSMLQYKDFGYAMRRGMGGLWRIDGYTAAKAGIAPPATPLTLFPATGPSGNLAAGKYKAVYTYGNQATGYEGNPSPDSNQLTLDGTTALGIGSYVWPPNPFVDIIYIYRSLINQDNGVYYLVGALNIITGSLSTLIEATPISSMGRQVSYNNNVPPTDFLFGDIWNERLFASNGRDVRFSESLLLEAFGGNNQLSINPDDGFDIRGIHTFDDRIIIGKTGAAYYVTGTDINSFDVHTLSDQHGVMSHFSMKTAEGILYFYGSGKAVYSSNGTTVKEISDPRVKSFLEAIPDSAEPFLSAAVFPKLGWYVLQLPPGAVNGLSAVHTYLVYNYRTQVWSVFQHDLGGEVVKFLNDTFATTEEEQMRIGTDAGNIFTFADANYNYDDQFIQESYDCSVGTVDGIIGDGTGAASGSAGANGFAVLCNGTTPATFPTQANGSGFYTFSALEGTYDLFLYDLANTCHRRMNGAVTIVGNQTTHMSTQALNALGGYTNCF